MRCEPCAYCHSLLSDLPRGQAPEGILALRSYEGVVRDLLTGVKYRRGLPAVDLLAGLCDELRPQMSAVDVITWAPTSARRRHQRGFDQAEQLARAVGRRWRLPVRSVLVRDDSPSQTGRSRRERLAGPGFRSRPIGRRSRVLVFDDVVTTGTTLRSAADALRRAGAATVACVAWAATPVPAALVPGGRPVPSSQGR
jgi:competence protein ComFC